MGFVFEVSFIVMLGFGFQIFMGMLHGCISDHHENITRLVIFFFFINVSENLAGRNELKFVPFTFLFFMFLDSCQHGHHLIIIIMGTMQSN